MNAQIRRLLGPVKPILRPVRDWVPYQLGRNIGPSDWIAPSWRARYNRLLAFGVRGMSRRNFLALKASYPYYKARGRYMSVASRLIDELSARYRLRTALELGPHLRPIATNADVLDIVAPPGLRTKGRVVKGDATGSWPFPDKAYDLVVALQVFEHLGDRQADAFREVVRVARHAIISLPVDWVMSDPANCHHGITEERVLGWFAPVKPTRVVEGNGGPKRRVIYVFENLPDGPPAAAGSASGAPTAA